MSLLPEFRVHIVNVIVEAFIVLAELHSSMCLLYVYSNLSSRRVQCTFRAHQQFLKPLMHFFYIVFMLFFFLPIQLYTYIYFNELELFL